MSGQIKYKTAEKYFLGGNSPDEGVSAFYFCFRKTPPIYALYDSF